MAQPREGGADGSTAQCVIEVKRQESLRLNDWMAQARLAAESDGSATYPVVAYRQNGQPWRCLVEMTPVQLAAFMRYSQNIGDTVASIERGISDLSA